MEPQIWDGTCSAPDPSNTSQCIVTVTQETKETYTLIQQNQSPNDDSGLSYFVKFVQTPVPEKGLCLIRLEIGPKKTHPIYIYNPSKEPTPEELKKYYQKLEFTYNSSEKPDWVLVNNSVWHYIKKKRWFRTSNFTVSQNQR